MKQNLPKIMMIAGAMLYSIGVTAQILKQEHLFPRLETNMPKVLTRQHVPNAERPTTMQSRLIAITFMEHDGAAYKRSGDSIRIYPRGLLSTELDFREYFVLAYGINLPAPVMPVLPRASLMDGIPLMGDSLVSYLANASGSAYDELNYRTELSYDDEGNVNGQLDQNYTGGDWVNDRKIDYTLDASARITEATVRSWDGSAWENDSRSLYTYDGSGALTEQVYLNWSGADWENNSKYVYEYDGDGNCITVIEQDGVGAGWENDERSLLTYNDDDRVSEYVRQDWIGGSWENDQKFYFTYTASGDIVTYIEQGWSAGAWENTERRTYTFTDGRVTELVLESFDGSDWNNEVRGNYIYDGDDNNTEIILQNWDLVGSNWENETRVLMVYNDYEQVTDLSMQGWNAGEFWESTVGAAKYVLYYEVYDDGNGIEHQDQDMDVSIYPNPADEQLHISIPVAHGTPVTFSIYDISGRMCLKQSLASFPGQINLDISRLPAGSYVLQTHTRSGTSSKSLQVVK